MLHVGEPVDAEWGEIPEQSCVRRWRDVANGTDGAASGTDIAAVAAADADPNAVVVRLRDDSERPERDAHSGLNGNVEHVGDGGVPVDRLGAFRDRFSDARILAYTVRDDPDAAIDASRLGVEYVSGRRLAADGETLADRITATDRGGESADADPDRGLLEPFVRIISDQTTGFDATVDALLDLGRDHLGLSVGYSARVDGDRIDLRRYRDPVSLVDSLAADDSDADGMVPLELTYCRETVRGAVPGDDIDDQVTGGDNVDDQVTGGDGEREPGSGTDRIDSDRSGTAPERDRVFSVADPEAAGLGDHPACERVGVGSYVGGRVVVDEEVFGTICFLDPESRDRPFDASEELFVELLAEWLGRAIERRLATNAVAAMDANERRRRLRTYEDALKNVDDMVCVLDADGVVTYATVQFAAWIGGDSPGSGTPDDGLVGRRLADLVSGDDADRVAEAVNALTAETAGGERGAGPGRTVSVTRESDGDRQPRHGELRLSPLSNRAGHAGGVVVSLSDTTDLRRTRTELSAERDRFRRLFDRIPDPVMEVVLEADETVVDGVNPAFEAQFGGDETALRGQTISALDIHDDRLRGRDEGDGGESADLDALIREHGFATKEVRRQTVDGPREFLFRGFSYETEGTRRAFGIYTDITDRKRRERYVRIVNRILRHNMRNELNVVFGFAGEIAERTDDETVGDFARRIEETGKRLAGVAEGATGLRRVVKEGYATDPDPVGVRAVVEEVVAGHATERPDAQIATDVPSDITVRGDDRLAVAVDHLVENAVEHGGDAPRVAVTAERDPDAGVVRVSVADDGPGIPRAVREVIAEDREVTQLRHNTGVGLWIAAWVVEAYGGDIRFDVGLNGEGTTVTIVLPAAEQGGPGR